MLKYLKNKFVIMAIILFSSSLTTILYCLKVYTELSLYYFLQNGLIVTATIIAMVLSESIFLLSVDSVIRKNIKFKKRFFCVIKSLWLAQFILLPVILFLFLVDLFVNLEFSTINKIVVFSISYLSQITLFFSYRFITKSSWFTTIKVVASQSILTMSLSLLTKFI